MEVRPRSSTSTLSEFFFQLISTEQSDRKKMLTSANIHTNKKQELSAFGGDSEWAA